MNNDDDVIHNVNNDRSFFINSRTTQSQEKNRQINSQKYTRDVS